MPDAKRRVDDWASARRRRWSATRIAAALALHALVLVALVQAMKRVQLPPGGTDHATTLVTVALHAAPPPPVHTLPLPRAAAPAVVHAAPRAPRETPAPARPREDAVQAITLPAPATPTQEAAASAPAPDLSFLDSAATRRAIHDAAHGSTLASRGNEITNTRETAGERLARNVDAAHKGDCMKGEYIGGGMGLLSAPFLLAAEALGNCSAK